MRAIRFAPFLIAAIGVAVVAYGLNGRAKAPPTVLSTSTFAYADKLGTTLIFPRRVVAVAGFQTTEVQLPSGTWIDCRADCAIAVRDQHLAPFDAQQQRR